MEAGGLLALGPDRRAQYRRAGYFVDAVLRGARPGELPIECTPVELSVNLDTADAMGIRIPPTVLDAAYAAIRPSRRAVSLLGWPTVG